MPIERVTRTIRLPADLAADVDTAAERCDLSTNRWIVGALRARLESPVVTVSGMVADAHTDRYPPSPLRGVIDDAICDAVRAESDRLIKGGGTGEPRGIMGRPVGSFDPDTDTPA